MKEENVMGLLGEIGKAILSSMESDAKRYSRDDRFNSEQQEAFGSMADMLNDARNGRFPLGNNDDDDE